MFPGPLPLVVYIHGGPHSAVMNSWSSDVTALLSLGYAVVLPNYAGYCTFFFFLLFFLFLIFLFSIFFLFLIFFFLIFFILYLFHIMCRGTS